MTIYVVKNRVISDLLKKLSERESQISTLENKLSQQLPSTTFSVKEINHNQKVMNSYAGLQNYEVFEWLYKHIELKAKELHYYKGESSSNVKQHQTSSISSRKKTWPK